VWRCVRLGASKSASKREGVLNDGKITESQ
jgi:hypothetical protein